MSHVYHTKKTKFNQKMHNYNKVNELQSLLIEHASKNSLQFHK